MKDNRILIHLRRSGRQVEVWQKGRGADLLLLHATTGWKGFEPLAEALAQSFRVTAPMHPGYGHSTGAESIDTALDAAMAVFELIEEMGIDKAHLVGHSMGGMIAAEMAALRPASFQRLVFMAPLGLWIDERPILDFLPMLPRDLVPFVFQARSHPAARAMGAIGPDAEHAGPYHAHLAAMASAARLLWPIPDRGLSRRMAMIPHPAIVIWGQGDRVVSSHYAQRFAEAMPKAKAIVIKRAGHLFPVEQPAVAASSILSFLGRKVTKAHLEAIKRAEPEPPPRAPAKKAAKPEPAEKKAEPMKPAETKKKSEKKKAKKAAPKKAAPKKKAAAAKKPAKKKTAKKKIAKKKTAKKKTAKKAAAKRPLKKKTAKRARGAAARRR
jgi:pimeloyl-ACP methyl ester carboxylesterase